LVFVEGSLQTRQWEDKDGNKRYTTEIRAQRVQFLDRGDSKSANERSSAPPHPAESEGSGFDQSFSDDDIPF
jgi:single-strand DNA-binding protein